MELSDAPTVHTAIGSVTVFTMSLKNIVHALRRTFAIAIALMFATVLAASAGDPPTLGTTELHTAAGSSGVAEVEVLLEVLLKAGADPRAIDKAGKTPLDVAKPEYRDILSKAMMDKPLK